MSILPINILGEYLEKLKRDLAREDEKEKDRQLLSRIYREHREYLIKQIQDVEQAINELKEKGEA